MDIKEPIANVELVNIVRKMKQGEEKEELFWKEISKSKFLCPIKIKIRNATQKEQEGLVLEEATNISLLSLDNNQGEFFLMAFTDRDEIGKWKQEKNQQTLVLTYEDYQKIIIKDDSPFQGMVINPSGENVVLSKQLLINMRKNEHIIQKGESVMLGIPQEYPTDMVNRLKEYFASTKNVEMAYLLWLVRGKGIQLFIDFRFQDISSTIISSYRSNMPTFFKWETIRYASS